MCATNIPFLWDRTFNETMVFKMSTLSKWQKWKSLWKHHTKYAANFWKSKQILYLKWSDARTHDTLQRHLKWTFTRNDNNFEQKRERNKFRQPHSRLTTRSIRHSDTIVRMQLNLRWCLVLHQLQTPETVASNVFHFIHANTLAEPGNEQSSI